MKRRGTIGDSGRVTQTRAPTRTRVAVSGSSPRTNDRYFRELGRAELLTREQEIEAFKRLDRSLTELTELLNDSPAGHVEISAWARHRLSQPDGRILPSTQRTLDRLALHCDTAAGAYVEMQFGRPGPRRKKRLQRILDVEQRTVRRLLNKLTPRLDDFDWIVARIEAKFQRFSGSNGLNGRRRSYRRKETYGLSIKELEQETQELRKQLTRAHGARDTMVRANLRLVVAIAKPYVGRGLPLIDLIQEGNLGLLKAIDRFEYRRGYKFSTYGTWWIRQAVQRAVADYGRNIRLPVHLSNSLRKHSAVRAYLQHRLGRHPTSDELAEKLMVSQEKVERLNGVVRDPISLDNTVGHDTTTTLGELVADHHTVAADDQAAARQAAEAARRALATLTPRERGIIELRFGIGHGKEHTLDEIGSVYGVTRERIRQIEAKTLEKLRTLPEYEHLKTLLNEA